MKIEKFLPSEIDQLSRIQPEGWIGIQSNFKFYTASDFCFPIKVLVTDQIIGVGATIIHEDCAWLAHIIVHPEHRNRGIGKIITQKLIDQATDKKCTTIFLLATELGSYVYNKLGFKTTNEYLFYKVPTNKREYTDPNLIVPYTKPFEEELLHFDKLVSGENRSTHLIPHLKNSFLFVKDEKLEGYFMPTLGEGLIVASSKLAGIALVKFRLNTTKNVIFPADNTALKQYMEDCNHAIYYRAKRMVLGKNPKVDLAKIYARIGGNLG